MASDFGNALDKVNGIHFSRYIASFLHEELSRDQRIKFRAWLYTLDLDAEDIRLMEHMIDNGKLELQSDYHKFSKLCRIKYSYSKPVKEEERSKSEGTVPLSFCTLLFTIFMR